MNEISMDNGLDEFGEDSLVFSGTSSSGDFSEALRFAIAEAKRYFQSSLVSWRLANMTGINGGFIGQTDLTVTIWAATSREATDPAATRTVLTPSKRYSYHTGYFYFAFGPGRSDGKGTAFIPAQNNGKLYGTTQLVFKRDLKLGGVDGWVYAPSNGFPSTHGSLWFASTPNSGGTTYTIKHKKYNQSDNHWLDYVTNAVQSEIQD